ncbi:MAG: hypothetical protein EB120_12740 [Proteobacteria bacterium]|nr:hypothetical protein [Pseudomonadota bacterium]
MTQSYRNVLVAGLVLFTLCLSSTGLAAKRKSRRRPLKPVTHPVILWSRTLSETTDPEQKKIAAFKLSQYSQPIYQDSVISTLISCMKDSDVQIRVLCAKAMGRAGNQSKKSFIRSALIETYKNDPSLRETLVRTFIARGEDAKEVQDLLLGTLKESTDSHEMLVILSYFYECGENVGPDAFIAVFNKTSDERVKRWAIKVLGENGNGEAQVVELLAQCAESKDTPLALNCLSGLQLQARKDSVRTWAALEKTIESSDPDMLVATLDVLNVLPENSNSKITTRLIEIIGETDDGDLIDKAILGLGVSGDHSEAVVDTLYKLLKESNTEESTKIHAALVLGKQAVSVPGTTREALNQCVSSSGSQALKTACQLGAQELADRVKRNERIPTSSPSPAKNTKKEE